ncbi:MAG: C-type lectin protein [Anaerolineales bacterium]|nr:C-type lectin protein [Anaerolineales bacterium]
MRKVSLALACAKAFTAAITTGIALASVNGFGSTFLTSTTYNGHTYELWDSLDISWADASVEATAGGGYLAAFTDAPETTTVYGALIGTGFFTANDGQQYQAWLGGYTTDPGFTTTDPTAWAWVTGEALTAFDAGNFAGGEPNGDSSGLSINRFGTSQWNDEGGRVGGFIVEKNGVPDAGSSLALLSGSFMLLAALARKVRQ